MDALTGARLGLTFEVRPLGVIRALTGVPRVELALMSKSILFNRMITVKIVHFFKVQ
jgi:hypothetical protein